MTKAELAEKIAASARLSKGAAEAALEVALASIKAALVKGQKVIIVGFGTFSVSGRKARKGRNPRTGAELRIPAARSPKFTAGKLLRDAVK